MHLAGLVHQIPGDGSDLRPDAVTRKVCDNVRTYVVLHNGSGLLVMIGRRVEPAHHPPQRLPDPLDPAGAGFRAKLLEVRSTSVVLGDPFPREVPRPNVREDLGHSLTSRLGDDPRTTSEVTVLSRVT